MSDTPIRLSVIVPVYNSPQDVRQCLTALLAAATPEAEILVVDDASTDETPRVAAEMGFRVLRMEKNGGPAAARNYGALFAQGEFLFFVDADVTVEPDTLKRVLCLFAEHPEYAAVFGSYDDLPQAPNTISQYRNLLHHYVHQTGSPEASTFWAGCGAIRRAAFEEVGGYDAVRFARPSIEDIELGHRLRQAGYRILLDRTLQVKHLKRWTLSSVVRTDVACRAIPWTRLLMESQNDVKDLNLKQGQRVSAALVLLACLLLPLTLLHPGFLALTAAATLIVVALNQEMYAFFWRKRGLRFAVASISMHFLYYLYSLMSYVYVKAHFLLAGSETRLALSTGKGNIDRRYESELNPPEQAVVFSDRLRQPQEPANEENVVSAARRQ